MLHEKAGQRDRADCRDRYAHRRLIIIDGFFRTSRIGAVEPRPGIRNKVDLCQTNTLLGHGNSRTTETVAGQRQAALD
jgi:hypothetical protein